MTTPSGGKAPVLKRKFLIGLFLVLFVLFGLLSSSSLLSVQHFGRCALRPSRLRQEGFRVRKEGCRVRDGSRVRQEIPEESRRAHRPKRCLDNNEDDDNIPNNTNNTNHQASSKKSREIVYFILFFTSENMTIKRS